jgi:choline dehydrogenase-like flavoprotein
MPGDSTQTQNNVTRPPVYDAIIVGSGISGGWAAKELCEKGLHVLMLERGQQVDHPNYPTAGLDPWQFPHRGSLTRSVKEEKYVQARHYSIREDNQHFYINDKQNPYAEIKRFDWIRADVVGGRSLLWARACYRLSDLDFEANLRDGHGADWPVRYGEMAPWYDYVEKFIGVSGQPEGLPHLPDGVFQPPMEMNCVEKHFKAAIESKFPSRKVTIGRTANLTEPLKGRGRCQYRDLCHRGCPYGAYFSTNASTLPAAFATGRLSFRTHCLVNRVIYDDQKKRATGVEIINTQTHLTETVFARIIFLNAATLATAFILLNSSSNRFPQGLGNDSDQVGRNLMDHHKTLGISGVKEGYEEAYYFGRRPTGIYIPRFSNLDFKQSGYLRGFGYQGSASRRPDQGTRNGDMIGASYKQAATEPGPWHMDFTGFGECLPYPTNRVMLNTDLKDHWGRNTLSVEAEFKENERAMHEDMVAAAAEMLQVAGCTNIRTATGMSFPGNSNHEMGTARMGNDPKTSVLNRFNQMHAVKNVFITDGSCMPSMGSVNPSLTYMALTARAVDYAVQEMKKQNI